MYTTLLLLKTAALTLICLRVGSLQFTFIEDNGKELYKATRVGCAVSSCSLCSPTFAFDNAK